MIELGKSGPADAQHYKQQSILDSKYNRRYRIERVMSMYIYTTVLATVVAWSSEYCVLQRRPRQPEHAVGQPTCARHICR